MSTIERVRELVEPIVEDLELELYDVEDAGGVLRILLDQPDGVGIDDLSRATRLISRALDEVDPVSRSYTLEVSSPGLERPLHSREHYRRAVGERVAVKTLPGRPDRRLRGELAEVDAEGVVIRDDDGSEQRVAYDEISKAHTIFEWGPQPKPGKGPGRRQNRPSKKAPAS